MTNSQTDSQTDTCPTCARLREWAEYVSRFDWRDGREARQALEEHMREHGETGA